MIAWIFDRLDRIPLWAGVLIAVSSGMATGRINKPESLALAVPVALFLMLYPMMLDVNLAETRQLGLRLPIMGLVLNFFASPILMSALLQLFIPENDEILRAGLILYCTVPCGGMVPAFTGMLNGNVSLAVTIMSASLLLSLVFVPLWTHWLLAAAIPVPPLLIFRHLCCTIVIPLIPALLTRGLILSRCGERTLTTVKERVKPLTRVGLYLLLFAMFALHGDRVLHHPLMIPKIACPVAALVVMLLLLSQFLATLCRYSQREATALAFSTGAKNNAIALALGFSVYGPDVAFVNAIAGPLVQLPVILSFIALRRRSCTGSPSTVMVKLRRAMKLCDKRP